MFVFFFQKRDHENIQKYMMYFIITNDYKEFRSVRQSRFSVCRIMLTYDSFRIDSAYRYVNYSASYIKHHNNDGLFSRITKNRKSYKSI